MTYAALRTKIRYLRFRMQRKIAKVRFQKKALRVVGIFGILVLLEIGFLTLFHPKQASAAWYSTSGTWQFRKRITIDHTKVPTADKSNFPVLISLTDPALQQAQSSGNDILFTSVNGTTKLNHEIKTFTQSTGNLIAWVQVPTLATATDTVLYMYYGNPTATSQQAANNTWNDGGSNYYKAVWHMTETSGNVSDSTSNSNTGTPTGTTSVTGKMGNARFFNGTSDFIQVGDNNSIDIGSSVDLTIEMWIKSTQARVAGQYPMFIDKEVLSPTRQGYQMYLHQDSVDSWGGEVRSAGTSGALSEATNIADGSWHFVVMKRSGANVYAFRNGAQVNSNAAPTGDLSNTNNLFMGKRSDSDDYYGGFEDEVRISATARSDDWIATEYNNQSSPSTFFSVSGQERGPVVLEWKFDEGTGTTANDTATGGHTGTLAASTATPTWQTEDMCVTGKCLKFDGSNDYLSRTYSSPTDTDLDPGTASFAVSLWFRHPTTLAGTEYLMNRFSTSGYRIYMNSPGGYINFEINDGVHSTNTVSSNQNIALNDNKWHFVEVVKNGTTSISMYIDGKLQDTQSSLSTTSSISGSSPTLYVGVYSNGTQ